MEFVKKGCTNSNGWKSHLIRCYSVHIGNDIKLVIVIEQIEYVVHAERQRNDNHNCPDKFNQDVLSSDYSWHAIHGNVAYEFECLCRNLIEFRFFLISVLIKKNIFSESNKDFKILNINIPFEAQVFFVHFFPQAWSICYWTDQYSHTV